MTQGCPAEEAVNAASCQMCLKVQCCSQVCVKSSAEQTLCHAGIMHMQLLSGACHNMCISFHGVRPCGVHVTLNPLGKHFQLYSTGPWVVSHANGLRTMVMHTRLERFWSGLVSMSWECFSCLTAVGTMHLGCFRPLLKLVVLVNKALQFAFAHDIRFQVRSGGHVVL